MSSSLRLILFFLLIGSIVTSSAGQTSQGQAPQHEQPAPATSNAGEKKFQANCGRCHNPPEELSPREARAVLRQMRVRAQC